MIAACLYILEAEETDEKYTLLNNQYECITDVYDKELSKNIVLSFSTNDFYNLSTWQMLHAKFSMPKNDIVFFYMKKRMPLTEIQTFTNVMPLRDAIMSCTDLKFLSAVTLYTAYTSL